MKDDELTFHEDLAQRMIAKVRSVTDKAELDAMYDELKKLAGLAFRPELLAIYLAIEAADALDDLEGDLS